MQEDITEKIQRFVDRLSSLINVQSPAQIRKVNEDGTVDIIVFKNDEIENQVIPHVKIKHLESGSAFVYLGANVGDYGVVRYFDSNKWLWLVMTAIKRSGTTEEYSAFVIRKDSRGFFNI